MGLCLCFTVLLIISVLVVILYNDDVFQCNMLLRSHDDILLHFSFFLTMKTLKIENIFF